LASVPHAVKYKPCFVVMCPVELLVCGLVVSIIINKFIYIYNTMRWWMEIASRIDAA